MKRSFAILVMVVCLLVAGMSALAYESELMDYGEVDFGGATVTIIGTGKPDLLESPEEDEYGKYPFRIEDAKEKFNIGEIVFEKTGWDEAGDIALNRIMAGDSEYDVYALREFHAISMAAKGSLFPVDTVWGPSYLDNIHPQTRKLIEKFKFDGHYYSVSNYFRNKDVIGFNFNVDIIEGAGFENPYDLYERGEWTWEKIAEIAKMITDDTDNDGEIDVWGIDNLPYDRLAFSNGAQIIDKVGPREYDMVMDSENSLETFAYLADLDDVIGGGWSNDLFENGQAAFSTAELFQLDKSFEFEYGTLPFPKGPSSEGDVVPTGAVLRMYLPVNSAQPKAMIALLDFLFPNSYVKDDINKEVKRRAADRRTASSLMNMLSDSDYGIFPLGYYLWGEDSAWEKMFTRINEEGENPAKVVKELQPEMQAIIDDVVSK